MLITTTDSLEGRRIVEYLGLVSGHAIITTDLFTAHGNYNEALRDAKDDAIGGARDDAIGDLIEAARELGADAVVGIDLDYELVGGSLLMVSANGTAVKVG